MRLSLCVISANQALFANAIKYAHAFATGSFDVFAFGNGVKLEVPTQEGTTCGYPRVESFQIGTTEANIGVPAALHAIWMMATQQDRHAGEDHVLAYIHDDVEILENGWDERVLRAFSDPHVGLVGFGGATGLGGQEIYKVAYEIHQLGRRDFYSNMVDAEVHGKRQTSEMPIVFTDGFSMFLRRSLLDKIDGWSWWPFHLVHHAYDYGIACMARRHGYSAMLAPCAVRHIGGQTAMMAVHQDMAKQHGGDTQVHKDSHRFVYETFRDVLPLRLPRRPR